MKEQEKLTRFETWRENTCRATVEELRGITLLGEECTDRELMLMARAQWSMFWKTVKVLLLLQLAGGVVAVGAFLFVRWLVSQ